jgi:type I restriction enzyme S subunit
MNIARQTVMPGAFPNEQFLHFSIPAWDERRAPALEVGASTGSAKISVTQPTLLVSKLNPRIPRVVHVKNPVGLRHCASTEFIPYVAKDDSVSLEFFRWFLQSSLFQCKLERIATGSTNSHTRARPGETLRWSVPCPTLEDQQRIAAVLDTVDEAIAKTEAVVAKLKQVRVGLLHDLLTCGLDEHGQLRDPIAHPGQFQDSLLGRIPIEWDEKFIDEIADVTKLAGFEFTNFIRYSDMGEIIALRALNIKDERLDLSDIQRIPKAASDSLPRSKIFAGDILITYIGAYIGDVLLITENDRFHLAPNIAKVTAKAGTIPEFLQWQLRSASTRRQIGQLITTTATPSLTMTQIRNLRLGIPRNIQEQRAICGRIDSLDAAIRPEQMICEKMIALKSGLMADLLTGRVRVPEHFGVRRHDAALSSRAHEPLL